MKLVKTSGRGLVHCRGKYSSSFYNDNTFDVIKGNIIRVTNVNASTKVHTYEFYEMIDAEDFLVELDRRYRAANQENACYMAFLYYRFFKENVWNVQNNYDL